MLSKSYQFLEFIDQFSTQNFMIQVYIVNPQEYHPRFERYRHTILGLSGTGIPSSRLSGTGIPSSVWAVQAYHPRFERYRHTILGLSGTGIPSSVWAVQAYHPRFEWYRHTILPFERYRHTILGLSGTGIPSSVWVVCWSVYQPDFLRGNSLIRGSKRTLFRVVRGRAQLHFHST